MAKALNSIIPNRFNKVQAYFELEKIAEEKAGRYPIARLKIQAKFKGSDSNLYSEDLSDYTLALDTENPFKDHYLPLFQELPPEDIISLSAADCPSELLSDFIEQGVHVLDKRGQTHVEKVYVFFGQSVYNLKDRECMLYNKIHGTLTELSAKFGKFETILNPAKKAARLSLLISPGTPTTRITNEHIKMIPDIMSKDDKYNFTDGAGLISIKCAKAIVDTLGDEDKEICQGQPYGVPCVFQIRVKGIKGILVVDPSLDEGIVVRPAMEKYECTRENNHLITLVAISKPTDHAALSEQYIRILDCLGIETQVFCTRLKSYFHKLYDYESDFEESLKTHENLQWKVLSESIKTLSGQLNRMRKSVESVDHPDLVLREYHRKKIKDKLCIPIPESRNLFGIPDPSGLLEEDECFFQITVNESRTVISGRDVVIGKCPCYHPGDMRKLKAVDLPELHYLSECLVFSVKGKMHSKQTQRPLKGHRNSKMKINIYTYILLIFESKTKQLYA